MFGREWTVQVYWNQTYLFAVGIHHVYYLTDRFSYRTHRNNHAVGIFSSVIVEQIIFSACDYSQFIQVFFYYFRNSIVKRIWSLASLEVDIRILSSTSGYRSFRIQSSLTEIGQSLLVNQRNNVFLCQSFNFLNFVWSSETIEEVHKRNTGLQSSQVSHSRHIHYLLHRSGTEHGKTSLTSCHNILMIAKDWQCLSSQSTSRHMEYSRKQLPCYFVHVRNHQQQPLRGCKCCR